LKIKKREKYDEAIKNASAQVEHKEEE